MIHFTHSFIHQILGVYPPTITAGAAIGVHRLLALTSVLHMERVCVCVCVIRCKNKDSLIVFLPGKDLLNPPDLLLDGTPFSLSSLFLRGSLG